MITTRVILSLVWVLATLVVPTSIAAQSVVLKAKTGDVRIEGKLVEFDGEYCRVETALGLLTVDGRAVTCTGDACPAATDMVSRFTISGSSELTESLLPFLIEAFALSLGGEVETRQGKDEQVLVVSDSEKVQVAQVTLVTESERKSFQELAKGGITIAATSRIPTDAELATVSKADLGNLNAAKQHQILAFDGIVAIVADVNPLKTVSLANLRKILRGDITNWLDVGGPDVPISLYLPTGVEAFDVAASSSRLQLEASKIPETAHVRGNLAHVADAVALDPFGLALTSFSNIRNARALGLKGACGIYVYPSVFTLKSGSYALAYTHSLYYPKVRLPVFAREFLGFVRSGQAQNVISVLGFSDLGISLLPLDQQGLRLANAIENIGKDVPLNNLKPMMDMMRGAERLSTTFRFEAGSKSLDRQSLQNADLLAAELILGNFADKQVYIAGFSDSAGGSARNRNLSKQRADMVRLALVSAAPDGSLDDVDFRVVGYGEASPLACEDTELGKGTNRRVEVWIKDRD